MSTRRVPIAQIGGPLAGFSLFVRRLGPELVRQSAGDLDEDLVRRSPVGTPGKTTKHPGKYRSSHTIGVGAPRAVHLPDRPFYPIPGRAEMDAELRSVTIFTPVFIANAARTDGAKVPYAPFLEPPRAASRQAPRGVYAVAAPALQGQKAKIVRRAVAIVGGEP